MLLALPHAKSPSRSGVQGASMPFAGSRVCMARGEGGHMLVVQC